MGFLGSSVTRAFFFFFIGTMGLGLGAVDFKNPVKWWPFLTGCVTIGHSLLVSCAICCVNVDNDGVEGGGVDRPPSLTPGHPPARVAS